MHDRRPGRSIWQHPGVVPLLRAAGPVKRDWYTFMGAFASAFATPTCMEDHEYFEVGEALVEEELRWKWLR